MTEAFDLSQVKFYIPIKSDFPPFSTTSIFYPSLFSQFKAS